MRLLKKVLIVAAILAFEIGLLELIAYAVLSTSSVRSYAAPRLKELEVYDYPRLEMVNAERPLLPRPGPVSIRDLSAPELRDQSRNVNDLGGRELALLIGGSSPYGLLLKNSHTFWWKVREQSSLPWDFTNTARSEATAADAERQLAGVLAQGARVRLLVVYTGDNEWLRFRHPRVTSPLLQSIDRLLFKTNIYSSLQLLFQYLRLRTVNKDAPLERHRAMFSLSSFCLDTAISDAAPETTDIIKKHRETVLTNFSNTLRRIILLARRADPDVRIIFLSTPLRYHLMPCIDISQFVSLNLPEEGQKKLLKMLYTAADNLQKGDTENAGRILHEAYEMDRDSVLTNFYMGWYFEKTGEAAKAREFFYESRNQGVGHSSQMKELNEALARVAAENDVSFIDINKAFEKVSEARGGGFNDELIMDWCHPNPAGTDVIAAELLKVLH